MKKCNFCGNKNFQEKRVQYLYRHDDRLLVMNNVPCEECDFCGEQYFKADVLKKIEKQFADIYQARVKATREIVVPVEEFVEL